MRIVTQAISQESGIPLGGLGTGSIEIRPDGYFHDWQIFNLGKWAPNQPECCRMEGPSLSPGALAFYVWTKQGTSAPMMRRLGMRKDEQNVYALPWLKSVESLVFDGRYPLATLDYQDDNLPVSVTGRFFSPMIPHESRTSGTPGFYAAYTVKNLTNEPVDITLMGTLQNPLAWGADDRKLSNTVSSEGDATLLTYRTAAEAGCPATLGSLSFGVAGGQASWIAGEYDTYYDTTAGLSAGHDNTRFGTASDHFLNDFRLSGLFPNLPGAVHPATVLTLSVEEIDALTAEETTALVQAVRRYPLFDGTWRRVARVDFDLLAGTENEKRFLQEMRARIDRLPGKGGAKAQWGSGALASKITLQPNEEREVVFTLGWHFPNHYSAEGNVLGHMYEHWFADAEAVNRFLLAHYHAHRVAVQSFADTLYDTTLEPEMADAWAGQLATLAKSTWWTKDDRFAVWEGLGCCGFHTTDITYQGSFNILALYPDLQLKQMELGAQFQREDGRVHHMLTPDLSHVDEGGFVRVDMNPQFVLLVCRDYLWTGDDSYARRLWPHIVRAMEAVEALDSDGDGLPDQGTKRNTYDAWNFRGTPAYIASLVLSGYLAGIRLAEDLGEADMAARWQGILDKATTSFENTLWNGEYYSLWVDGDLRDECCMTDQIDGEWFTHLIGLGSCLPRPRILAALRSVMRYNFTWDTGLINASYPQGRSRRISTYRNFQAVAPWTGIEYAIASMMLDFGMVAEGLVVVDAVHERYLRAGRFWNHFECGDHYYRAMASWAILLASTGFKIDVPRQLLTIVPVVRRLEFRAPWCSATGWGRFLQTDYRFELHCQAGTLAFRTLHLKLSHVQVTVTLNGETLPVTSSEHDGLVALTFADVVTLAAGDALVVE